MNLTSIISCLLTALVACHAALAEDRPASFPKGTISFQTYASYADGIDAKEIFYSGAIGGSYYVFDNLSLGLEANGFRVVQTPGHNTTMYGLSGVLRHHIFDIDEHFTVFADVSFGPVIAGDRIPAGGTYFNFTPRTGLGATWRLRDHTYLLSGVRYFHLSNAHIEGRQHNPSVNGLEGFVGLMWTF